MSEATALPTEPQPLPNIHKSLTSKLWFKITQDFFFCRHQLSHQLSLFPPLRSGSPQNPEFEEPGRLAAAQHHPEARVRVAEEVGAVLGESPRSRNHFRQPGNFIHTFYFFMDQSVRIELASPQAAQQRILNGKISSVAPLCGT